ncbi:DoxX family protein [Chryseobacterium sp. R2A-55]|uniref:DoxX family protein n=1 Tax=Chryseobacterium sp. R2A-55 TaxID=2744445 RepID=UPI001F219DF1|nr:MauE/DoxX family redox-associated membrane protein [Chryseobacterium sp. R2A-55]
MKTILFWFPKMTTYFFALLFTYAAVSKILDFENFQVQIAQSPLLSAYAGTISYGVIIIELAIVILLLIQKTNRLGLYGSLSLMTAFTVYIYLILNYSDFVPCSCGGILEKMGWTEHLVFNIGCVLLAALAIACVETYSNRKIVKYGIVIGSVICICSILVLSLFYSSEYIIKKENNFTRRFLIHPVIEEKVFDLKVNSFYFAGQNDEKLYLGNVTAPLVFTTIDQNLSAINQKRIKLPRTDFPFRNLQVQTWRNYFFISDGSVPVIFKGSISKDSVKIISYRDAYFTQMAVLDSTRFALRTQSKYTQQYTLASLYLNRKPKTILYPNLLQKQVDGVFDSDGKLILSHSEKKFAYVYSYRNQYLLADSNFNLFGRFKTIDTVNQTKITVKAMEDGRHKMTVPAIKGNINSVANQNLLFVESGLMGKYEPAKSWKFNSVIDIYRIDKQEYVGSFYIKKRNDKSISDMYATDTNLFVIIGSEIVKYKFTRPIINLYKGKAENLK